MRESYLRTFVISMFMLTMTPQLQAQSESKDIDEWKFDVYLDDKRVGTHVFEVVDAGAQREVQSVANFKLKILFISAYSYQHTNIERWDEDCLLQFEARTRVNGKHMEVSGTTAADGFMVENGTSKEILPSCVMSFAYWNPAFLEQERLLNPQTGEFLDVSVETMGPDFLEVRGEKIAAARYKVTARGIDLMLWYSADDEWLRLESVAKGGHIIRYELV